MQLVLLLNFQEALSSLRSVKVAHWACAVVKIPDFGQLHLARRNEFRFFRLINTKNILFYFWLSPSVDFGHLHLARRNEFSHYLTVFCFVRRL